MSHDGNPPPEDVSASPPPSQERSETSGGAVPDSVIPRGSLPPLEYRDLPEPIPLRRMIGPSLILAGLALGSGEFVLWPYITYKTGFVFFWACLIGVTMQYFLNMEITRWTLATGESAITGFVRMNKHWAWVFLVLNIVPWVLPAWATGAAEILSWMFWGVDAAHVPTLLGVSATIWIAIGGMVLCGVILTAGPSVYETVEKVQMVLVTAIMLMVIVLAVWLISGRPDAVAAQAKSVVTLGAPDFVPQLDEKLTAAALLGALAFAGAGGTLNLGQSNFIKDKGYGMGRHIGRITSPITGQAEAVSEVGYHFEHTPQNMSRWRQWWRSASWEHFINFFLTCLICLVLLTLVSYILFFDSEGNRLAGADRYSHNITFIWGQAESLEGLIGGAAKTLFLIMGVAILFTTEFGVLDATSRVSSDLVKVAWLRENRRLSEGALYYIFLWGTIAVASTLLLVASSSEGLADLKKSFVLFTMTAALNGGVMFLYAMTLLYLNRRKLPAGVRMSNWRMAIMLLIVAFFGAFAAWAVWDVL